MNKFRVVIDEPLKKIPIKPITWASLSCLLRKWDREWTSASPLKKVTSNLDELLKGDIETNIETLYIFKRRPGFTIVLSRHDHVNIPAIIKDQLDQYALVHIDESCGHLTFEKL